jgi:hypothetical protein
LIERMRRKLHVRHYSLRTEQSYLQWVERFLSHHGGESALDNDAGVKVREFLEHLALGRNVSANTQNQAFSALLFLYTQVQKQPLDGLKGNHAGTVAMRFASRAESGGDGSVARDARGYDPAEGKGGKDRLVMLPESLEGLCNSHLERVHILHEQNAAAGSRRISAARALGEISERRPRTRLAVGFSERAFPKTRARLVTTASRWRRGVMLYPRRCRKR